MRSFKEDLRTKIVGGFERPNAPLLSCIGYRRLYLAEVFTSDARESRSGEWLAISSRINTWLFSLFRQTKQPSWNPNRPASPKFNLVFACGYTAQRQQRGVNLHRTLDVTPGVTKAAQSNRKHNLFVLTYCFPTFFCETLLQIQF